MPPPAPAEQTPAGGQLAIIIDDLGYDLGVARAVFALATNANFPHSCPFTVAVLPHLPASTQVASEAHDRGCQVLLHLPMQSLRGNGKPEAVELRPGLSAEETAAMIAAMLSTVPHAAGVNNHQGSRATADPQLMGVLMSALAGKGLFFVDSRTTSASVAYDVARLAGVRSTHRDIFLDDPPTRENTLRQLAAAARMARERGSAMAIAHPHPSTLDALRQFLPQLSAQGVRLVPASSLVQ